MYIFIDTINYSRLTVDLKEWTISTCGEIKKINITKFDIKTIYDLSILISEYKQIPQCVVKFIEYGKILPEKTLLENNMVLYLFYKAIVCKKHENVS